MVPAGSLTSSIAVCTSALAVPRLSLPGVALIVAERSPLTVVIVAGPSTWETVARASRRRGPVAVGTSVAASASTVVGGSWAST